MRRKRADLAKFAAQAVALGMEANWVIARRLARLALGGPMARRESRRMVSEKIAAAGEAGLAAAQSVLKGAPHKAPEKALAVYRKKVRGNAKRLGG